MGYRDLPPRVVKTDATFWKAVGLISGARKYGNKNVHFGSFRSRGAEGDIRTEIMGVWGELAAWIWADESGLPVSMPCLVSLTGPSSDVDFRANLDGEAAGMEAKAWSAKRLNGEFSDPFSAVNINVTGHERSAKRGGNYYIFSFGIIGGNHTLVGTPLLHGDVDLWEKRDGTYGDPYYARPVNKLIPEVVRGKNAFAMVRWIKEMGSDAGPNEELVSYWREAAEDRIEEIMIACSATSAVEFLGAVRSIRDVPA